MMIPELPRMMTPDWLVRLARNPEAPDLDLKDVLREVLADSLYYPACGLNGTPVKFLAGNVLSFVYADYRVTEHEFLQNLNGTGEDCGFRGYHSVLQRDVVRSDIVPERWTSPLRPTRERDIERLLLQEKQCRPFGHWSIWKRDAGTDENSGPELFSFLYFGGEMSAIYQGLYCRLRVAPLILALIQPGAIGGEWEKADAGDSFFKKVVLSNPAGMPEYLLHGGSGGPEYYSEPWWHEYKGPRIVQLPERYAGLWRKSIPGEHAAGADQPLNVQPEASGGPAWPKGSYLFDLRDRPEQEGLDPEDPEVQAFMAKLDGEYEPGYAEQMLTDDPILFESLCNEWLGEQEHERLFGRPGYRPRNAWRNEDDIPDGGDHDPAIRSTRSWLRAKAPRLRETTIATLAAEADRDYLKLFESSGLSHRTLDEICHEPGVLQAMAQTGNLNLDDQDKGLVNPDTVVARSHDTNGDGTASGPGYYGSFRHAVEGELIVYLAADLDDGDQPAQCDLRRYKRICRRLYAIVLLHRRNRNTSKACALVRRVLDEFTGSQGEWFHPLRDSLRHDGYPLEDPEEFHTRFAIPVQEADLGSPDQWQWIVDHLERPYV